MIQKEEGNMQNNSFFPLDAFACAMNGAKNVLATISKQREPFTVRLLFDASVVEFDEDDSWGVKDIWIEADIWIEEQTVYEDRSVEVSFKTTQFEEIKRFVLGQGATVRVLEPPELLQAVQKEIEEMRKLYKN